jgi:hypothetical protein
MLRPEFGALAMSASSITVVSNALLLRREVPAPGGAALRTSAPASAAAWTLSEGHARPGVAPGPLFWPVTKGGKLSPRRPSAQAMLYVTHHCGRARAPT